jgi:hypothetical protein
MKKVHNMTQFKMNSIFDAMGDLFSDEASIAVSNTEVYIYYRPSKRIDLKIKKGDPVKDGTITYKALTDKQKVSEFMDRDLFGVPYYGMAVPLMHDGKLEGCVSAIFPTLTTGKSVVTVKYMSWKRRCHSIRITRKRGQCFKKFCKEDKHTGRRSGRL